MDMRRPPLQAPAETPVSAAESALKPAQMATSAIESALKPDFERQQALVAEMYMSRLIWDARSLALTRIHQLGSTKDRVYCVDCRAAVKPDHSDHKPGCQVARVLLTLAALAQAYPIPNERSCAEEAKPAPAAVEGSLPVGFFQERDFGESWTVTEVGDDRILCRDGRTLVDMAGSDLDAYDDADFARRICACVNSCTGIPTSDLEAWGKAGVSDALLGLQPVAKAGRGVEAIFGQGGVR